MEERILDKDESKGIKLKRLKNGATDAVEEGLPGEGEDIDEGEEVLLELPESDGEEYDENLVGLTPAQLKEELERRERVKKEAQEACVALIAEGEALLKDGAYEKAAELFSQAVYYDPENEQAVQLMWIARTHDFENLEAVYEADYAEGIAGSELQRTFILSRAGEALKKARAEYIRAEKELAPVVESKQAERREAFGQNRRYYKKRLTLFAGLCLAFLIALFVSADNILRTQSVLPIVFTGIFGALAFAALVVAIVCLRKLYVATQLCDANERLSATEDGARLEDLRGRLYALECILGKSEE